MEDIKKTIGLNINSLLADKDKTQKDLAAAIGVLDNTISYYCSGRRTPDYAKILMIADYFNVSVDSLLGHSVPQSEDESMMNVCNYTGLTINAVKNIKDLSDITFLPRIIESAKFIDLILAFQDFNDHVAVLSSWIEDIENGKDVSINLKNLRMLHYAAKYEKYEFIEICSDILNELCGFDDAIQDAGCFLENAEGLVEKKETI